jgi:hypothetical protein
MRFSRVLLRATEQLFDSIRPPSALLFWWGHYEGLADTLSRRLYCNVWRWSRVICEREAVLPERQRHGPAGDGQGPICPRSGCGQ